MKVTEILSGPEKWIRGAYGRTASGVVITNPKDLGAEQALCLEGALRVAHADSFEAFQLMGEIIRDLAGNLASVSEWNDASERTFAEVHAVAAEFDRRWMLTHPTPQATE